MKVIRRALQSMMTISPGAQNALVLSVLLLLLFFQQFRSSSFLFDVPSLDSGVFLYGGQQINLGKVPYLDFWDHKSPLIFFINALGLQLSGGEAWGVWLIEFALLCFSLVTCYQISRKLYGMLPALFACMLFILGLRKVAFVNLTETYAIPIAFIALWAYWKYLQTPSRLLLGIIGIAGAGSFLLRPNMIGVYIGIAVCLLVYPRNGYYKALARISFVAIGFLTLVGIFLAYFVMHHALAQYIDAAFVYNRFYSAYKIDDMITTAFMGYLALTEAGVMLPALIGLLCSLIVRSEDRFRPFILAIAIGLPIEMVLSSISGNIGYGFLHYFATWLPMLAFLAAFFGHILLKGRQPITLNFMRHTIRPTIGILVLSLYLFVLTTSFLADNSMRWIWRIRGESEAELSGDLNEIIHLVSSQTNTNDTVLFWGAATKYNYLSARSSPTRFVYQLPLFTPGYQSAEIIQEVYDDLAENQPKLIVDASPSEPEIFPPLNRSARKSQKNGQWNLLPETEMIFTYIETNYESIGTVGESGWEIYVRK